MLTAVCMFIASLQELDPEFVPEESSQQSTESQLEAEMRADPARSHTPPWGDKEPDTLKRLMAPPGTFGSPQPPGDMPPREVSPIREQL